jgi:hypothetical protein
MPSAPRPPRGARPSPDGQRGEPGTTLTNLYNQRPSWLDAAHARLDEAVADAYGWGEDARAGRLDDDAILARRFDLNQARAGRR